jgi:hypothetical protein
MALVYEVAFSGDRMLADAVRDWFNAGRVDTWARLPGLSVLDVYRPADGGAHDPFNADTNGPLLVVICEFGRPEAHAAARPTLEEALSSLPPGVGVTMSGLERRFYAVAGQTSPAPLQAAFSYVVRYHRPAEDEAAFVANYVAMHPATLAKLPHIRSIMCYFPVQVSMPSRFAAADYIIGNEVAFDSIADFNVAMQSPIRHELRAHFNAFPRFSGPSTHFPMNRTRLIG